MAATQQFYEIQDRHLELWLLGLFHVTDVFQIKVEIFLLNLAMLGQMVKTWHPFLEIRDGGRRHLEYWLRRNDYITDVF